MSPFRKAALMIAIAMVIAAAVGWLIGGPIPERVVVPEQREPAVAAQETREPAAQPQPSTAAPDEPAPPPPPEPRAPLWFETTLAEGADQAAVRGEIRMAANAGIHRYVLPAALAWGDSPEETHQTLVAAIGTVLEEDAQARFVLRLDLNPSPAWLADNPESQAQVEGEALPYASAASEAWQTRLPAAFEQLIIALDRVDLMARIDGFILSAMHLGNWHDPGIDEAPANAAAFRAWLRKRYAGEEAFAAAWGIEGALFDEAMLPEDPAADATALASPAPEIQPFLDYATYVQVRDASCIESCAEAIRGILPESSLLYLTYGYSLEQPSAIAAHAALEQVLEMPIDGFVSPVSYTRRGLGEPGGFMGPLHAALRAGKQWIVVDDTRTGITRDPDSGTLQPVQGILLEDVFNVQARNFGAALANNAGLIWSDAAGAGALHDEAMWQRFGRMRQLYLEAQDARGPEAPDTDSNHPLLTVAVQEEARLHQIADSALHQRLLRGAADAALQSGMATRFVLMRDVLAGEIESAVYLFLNAFVLSEGDREQLHRVLDEQQATAIWLYAPGYVDAPDPAEAISLTTGFPVQAFEEGGTTGSVWKLPGDWLNAGTEFGVEQNAAPLFYVETPEEDDAEEVPYDLLAEYRDSEEGSVAIRFREESWASIYIADPNVTAPLLRELLRILEQPLAILPSDVNTAETLHFAPRTIVLHAANPGERALNLGGFYDVVDLLDPSQGWFEKRVFSLLMQAGETRILRLNPVADRAGVK